MQNTAETTETIRMWDGLDYPLSLLESRYPRLFAYRKEHEIFEETVSEDDFFPPKSFRLPWILLVFGCLIGSVALLIAVILPLVEDYSFRGFIIFPYIALIGGLIAHNIALVVRSNDLPRTIRIKEGFIHLELPGSKINLGHIEKATFTRKGFSPLNLLTLRWNPQKCFVVTTSDTRDRLQIGLTEESHAVWEEFLKLRKEDSRRLP